MGTKNAEENGKSEGLNEESTVNVAVPKSEKEAVKKEDPEDVSTLEKSIIRQVEYYFGDFNLSKDKFLREQMKENDGWIPLETMIKFNRLKQLSEDFGVICAALRKSTNDLIEVNEESTKIRRTQSKPIPDESFLKEAVEEKSLYVKGFKKTTSLDELLEYFKPYNVENITMRRRWNVKDKPFKGSCFVTFPSKEDAEKFLGTSGIKFENTELLKEKKKDYIKRKDEFYKNLKAEKAKKLQERMQTKPKDESKTGKETGGKGVVKDLEMVPGCLLKVSGLSKECTREAIKEALQPHGNIVFVDYFRGNPEAVVRFESAVASTVIENAEEIEGEKKLNIGSCRATLALIEGETETEYWKNIAVSRANSIQRLQNQKGKGRFGKKNFGGRQKRGRNDEGGPSKKKPKIEKDEDNEETIKNVGDNEEKSEIKAEGEGIKAEGET